MDMYQAEHFEDQESTVQVRNRNTARLCIALFTVIFVLGIVAFAAINYFSDPYGYFAMQRGEIVTKPYIKNLRLMLENVFHENPSDTYTGIIVGGSKSAVLSPAIFEYYTGNRYYNANISYGNFEDYETVIRYAFQHQQIKHVVLHLSGLEVYDPALVGKADNESNRMPEVIYTGSDWADMMHYAFLGMNITMDELVDGYDVSKKTTPVVLGKTVQEELERIETAAGHAAYLKQTEAKTRESYETYAQKYVIDYYGPFDWTMGQLFEYYQPDLIYKQSNIDTLIRIKNICEAYGAELTVIMGATFIGELYLNECPDYWEYIYDMAQITDIWDFSYYCDYNRNPYNFFNAAHNLAPIAWQMVMNMYGERVNDYGQLITKENALEKVTERMQAYYTLQKQWRETGNIELEDYDDPSNISVMPDWVYEMDL